MEKDLRSLHKLRLVKIIPKPKTTSVGAIVPAGAREVAEDEAMFAGSEPMVSLKETVVEPDVMLTVLSPDKSAVGVHDQLPEALAVAETVCEPTLPETVACEVVTPEKVGRAEETQNCFAP